ncbi:flagellar biosynthesis repressor FlbT [Methylobacterium sp. NFXW15]|uniref:flagellar biosynthesis repressor FlbT n=1 Tax=Methylobacterium sp. NFXW15 TaxID=2819512 RepID=UPI003CF27D99
MSRSMHISLCAGERVFINGAVLRVDRKVGIELLNDASFLLEGHVLQAEQATTPLRQLYFAAQTLLIDPAQAEPARDLCAQMMAGILAATRDEVILTGLASVHRLIELGRLFEALKTIRGLYAAEAAVLTSEGGATPPVATSLRPGREVPPRHFGKAGSPSLPRGPRAPSQPASGRAPFPNRRSEP